MVNLTKPEIEFTNWVFLLKSQFRSPQIRTLESIFCLIISLISARVWRSSWSLKSCWGSFIKYKLKRRSELCGKVNFGAWILKFSHLICETYFNKHFFYIVIKPPFPLPRVITLLSFPAGVVNILKPKYYT